MIKVEHGKEEAYREVDLPSSSTSTHLVLLEKALTELQFIFPLHASWLLFPSLNPSLYQGSVLICFEQAARPGYLSAPVEFGCSGNRAQSSHLVCFQPSFSTHFKYTEMKAIPKKAVTHPLED